MGKLDTLTAEETNLRRRARRRLVGAVALVLLAVVVLPLLFNPEPKPLGSDVEIRIPDQTTPFEPTVSVPPAQDQGGALPAQGVPPLATPPAAQAGAMPAPASAGSPSLVPARTLAPSPTGTPAKKSDKASDKTADKATDKPVTPVKPAPPVKPTPTDKPAMAEKKPAAEKATPKDKSPTPVPQSFSAQGYFLQLGAFSSEVNARQLADKARAAGFNPSIQTVGGQVRVRIGPYRERQDALQMQEKLRAKGIGAILLGP